MIQEVIFDIETQKLFSDTGTFDPADLGVSIVSAYVRQVNQAQQELSGKIMSFWERDLPNMWEHFRGAKRIIGFNSVKFDVPALRPYAPADFARLPHFDVLGIIRTLLGHSLSLNTLASATLGKQKTDVGTNAVNYWRNGTAEDLRKLQMYCEADVILTKELYDYAVKNKHLKYHDKWNSLRTVSVDFSYPKDVLDASRQIGLF